MITLRRMRLGSGFRYLMDSVAAGDGGAKNSTSLTRYYADSGTPPGVFLGGGLAALGDGRGIDSEADGLPSNLLSSGAEPRQYSGVGCISRSGP
jgi:hypothetical protein